MRQECPRSVVVSLCLLFVTHGLLRCPRFRHSVS
ncbi:hypothetical protein [Caudoviricetes sp.]|nr:hypothetical protein [Caudoviricetes sp.]UOF79858.1 hypothetical protein [Bacteriophage sp.]